MIEPAVTFRRTRHMVVVAIVGALALIAVACNSDSGDSSGSTTTTEPSSGTSELPPESELVAGLLTLEDMPEGWVDVSDEFADDDDDSDDLCGVKLTEILDLDEDELPNAEAAYAADPQVGPLVLFAIGFVPEGRGGEAFAGAQERFEACDEAEDDDYTYTVAQAADPMIGDESMALTVTQIDVETSEVLEFSIVYSRTGDLLVVVGAVDPFGGDTTDLLEEYAAKAVERANEELNS